MERGAEEDGIDADGIEDGVEVGGTILVEIDGLDGDLDGAFATAEVGEDAHLVLVALALEVHEGREDGGRQGAEAGLGVGKAGSGEEAEELAGQEVAEAAGGGDVGAELAGAEHRPAVGFVEGFGYANDVLNAVLAVGVGGDDSGEAGVFAEDVVDAGLEGPAFAEVDSVAEDVDPGLRTKVIKDWRTGQIASVVDHDDGSEAVRF